MIALANYAVQIQLEVFAPLKTDIMFEESKTRLCDRSSAIGEKRQTQWGVTIISYEKQHDLMKTTKWEISLTLQFRLNRQSDVSLSWY